MSSIGFVILEKTHPTPSSKSGKSLRSPLRSSILNVKQGPCHHSQQLASLSHRISGLCCRDPHSRIWFNFTQLDEWFPASCLLFAPQSKGWQRGNLNNVKPTNSSAKEHFLYLAQCQGGVYQSSGTWVAAEVLGLLNGNSVFVEEEAASEFTDVWLPKKTDTRIQSVLKSSWKTKSNVLDTGVKNFQQIIDTSKGFQKFRAWQAALGWSRRQVPLHHSGPFVSEFILLASNSLPLH